MGDYSPIFPGGTKPRTYTAGGTIVGRQVMALSGANTVVAASANSTAWVGVAAHDAASGAQVTVWPFPGVTHELTASAAITVGSPVAAAATGQVGASTATNGADIFGVAKTAAGAGGVLIEVEGR